MFAFTIFILFSPGFVLSLLLLPAINRTEPQAYASEILCYDSRYADHRPTLSDCARIIGHFIATPPSAIHRIRTFSRRPTYHQLPLPQTWKTPKDECAVTIDIPSEMPETATASLMDVKRTAFDVLTACVYGADHLGGFTQTGRVGSLQVSVEAGDRSTEALSELR
ncbi:MAG: hypothetical protein Q9211_003715 [Gyalolechia sp. 1 TL-2023]